MVNLDSLHILNILKTNIINAVHNIGVFASDIWLDAVQVINNISRGLIDQFILNTNTLDVTYKQSLTNNIVDGANFSNSLNYYSGQACMDTNILFAEPKAISGTTLYRCFYNCYLLQACVMVGDHTENGYGTSNVTSLQQCFTNCFQIQYIDVNKWDMSKVTSLRGCFFFCINLTNLDVSNWNLIALTDLYQAFMHCYKLQYLDVSNWDVSHVTTLYQCFQDCYELNNLDVSNWNVGNVTNFQGVFYKCKALTNIDVSNWNTSNGTTFNSMFQQCTRLTSLDLSHWDTSKSNNFNSMFQQCSNLTNVNVSGWIISSDGIIISNMFHQCSKLSSLDISSWTGTVSAIGSFVGGCTSLHGTLDFRNLQINNVTSVQNTLAHIYVDTILGWTLSGISLIKDASTSVTQYNANINFAGGYTNSNLVNFEYNGILYRGITILRFYPNLTVTSLVSWFNALYDWRNNPEQKESYEVIFTNRVLTQGPTIQFSQAQANKLNSEIYYDNNNQPYMDPNEGYAWTLWDYWTNEAITRGWTVAGAPNNQRPTINN